MKAWPYMSKYGTVELGSKQDFINSINETKNKIYTLEELQEIMNEGVEEEVELLLAKASKFTDKLINESEYFTYENKMDLMYLYLQKLENHYAID